MSEQRWCFVRDNDGHNYLILTKDRERFYELLDAEDDDGINDEFEACRCRYPGAYSFVDPKEGA